MAKTPVRPFRSPGNSRPQRSFCRETPSARQPSPGEAERQMPRAQARGWARDRRQDPERRRNGIAEKDLSPLPGLIKCHILSGGLRPLLLSLGPFGALLQELGRCFATDASPVRRRVRPANEAGMLLAADACFSADPREHAFSGNFFERCIVEIGEQQRNDADRRVRCWK